MRAESATVTTAKQHNLTDLSGPAFFPDERLCGVPQKADGRYNEIAAKPLPELSNQGLAES